VAEDLRICAGQFYEADQLDSALDLFTRATELDPADPRGWHGKGATLGRLLRHDEAQAAFNEAIRLKPDYVAAIWHRGCDHSVNLQRDAALADLRLAISLDSTVKRDAQQDKCFEWLWANKEFLAIVK
jgi:tetratricopeptide (TPR) repeat protein